MRKILVLTRCFPVNFDTAVYGVFQRFRLFLEALSSFSAEIHIVFMIPQTLIDTVDSINFQKNLEKRWGIGAKVYLFPIIEKVKIDRISEYFSPIFSYKFQSIFAPTASGKLFLKISPLINNGADLIFVHRLNSMPPVLNIENKKTPVIFDLDDIEHKKFFRDLKLAPFWLGKLFYYLHLPSIFYGEIIAIRKSSITFVCSEVDKNYLKKLNSGSSIEVLPNSVVFPPASSNHRLKNVILFVGSYTYGPNVDAAERLLSKIFPLIRAEIPTVELWLVGNKIESLKGFGDALPGVRFLGFVESLDKIYQDVTLVCCPIHSGGGTRIKIIEAASHGVPVVSTTLGAEGLDLEDGRSIVIADSDHEFAAASIKLLRDEYYAENIGLNGRKTVEPYSRSSVLLYLKSILQKIAVPQI